MSCRVCYAEGVRRARFLLPIAILAIVTPSEADTFEWTDPVDGNFNAAGSWTVVPPDAGAPPPGSTDTANFNEEGDAYTVFFTQDEDSFDLNLLAGNPRFTSSASSLVPLPPEIEFDVADDMLVTGGTELSIFRLPDLPGAFNRPLHLTVTDNLVVHGDSRVILTGGTQLAARDFFFGNNNGDAEIVVSGVLTTLRRTGTAFNGNNIAQGGATASVTFLNGASGDLDGALLVGVSGVDASDGTLSVLSGASVELDEVLIATTDGSQATGLIEVDAAQLTQTGASPLTVGSASGGTGTLNIRNGATYNTGTGAFTINATGTVNTDLPGAGSLNASGPVNIVGGALNIGDANDFNLAAGQTLTASSGGQVNFGFAYQIIDNTTFELNSGADVSTGLLDVGVNSGDGALIVDGMGSTVTTAGTSVWGFSGRTANVTFRNQASGNLAGINLADSSIDTSVGNLSVETNADVTTGNLNIAREASGATGTIVVDGAGSTFTQAGASTLTVGSSSGTGSATINVQNDGSFSTGTGATTINATGTLNVGLPGGGAFNANGPVNVVGGALNVLRGGILDAVEFNLADGQTLTASADGQLQFGIPYSIGGSTTFEINSGADLIALNDLDVGALGGDGKLLVDGAGSTVTATALLNETSTFGSFGSTADVTFRNQASGSFANVSLGTSAFGTSVGNLTIETSAQVNAANINIATIAAGSSGTITVSGIGSTLTQGGASTLTVGSDSGTGSATINVQNNGVFRTGTGVTTVNATGAINVGIVGEGIFNANGPVNVDGGALNVGDANDFDLAAGQTLAASNDAQLELNSGLAIERDTTFELNSGADLSVDGFFTIGGIFGIGTLIADGVGSTVTMHTGNTAVGGGSGASSVSFRNEAVGNLQGLFIANSNSDTAIGDFLIQTNADVSADVITIATRDNGATGTLTVDGAGSTLTQSGAARLDVGSASGLGSATINVLNSGVFTTGSGAITIDATGTLNIEAAPDDPPARFVANGPMTVSGQVNLPSIPINGGLMLGGTLEVNAGLSVDGGSVAMQSGAIDADAITLTSGGQFNFTGGTLSVEQFNGNLVNQGGTLAPGASAGSTTIVGDYTQQAESVLEIEIGGASAVTEHDFVSASGTVALDGLLEISLIDDFTPNPTDAFTVLTAGSLAGFFDNATPGARLDTTGGEGSFLVNIDFGFDQIVLSDFLAALSADQDGDLDVDGADFLAIQRNNPALIPQWETDFGTGVPSPSSSQAVPEPSGWVLLLAATAMVSYLQTTARSTACFFPRAIRLY